MNNTQKALINQDVCEQTTPNLGITQSSGLDHHAIAQPYQDERMRGKVQLIRRLTPLECERLQAFPDDWTNIPGASDSARYRALGNSVAIPCVEFIMKSLREVTELEAEQSQVQGDYHAEK